MVQDAGPEGRADFGPANDRAGDPMDLILHIGAHRTGTTTFQQYLQRNVIRLGDAGVEAWTPDRTRQGLFAGLLGPDDDMSGPAALRRAERATGLIRLRMDDLWGAGRQCLLVSEENMIGTPRGNLIGQALYPGLTLRLERFLPAFEDGCIRIGIAIRSYETFWASCLAYGLSRGHPPPSARALGGLAALPRRWPDVIAEVARLFPMAEVVVWPFEEYAARPDAVLSHLTGRAAPGAGRAGRQCHNASPAPVKLRHLMTLRGTGGASGLLRVHEGRWMPFDDDQIAAMQSRYAADVARLKSVPPPGVRFCTDTNQTDADRWADNHQTTPDRAREATGFRAPARPWMPPEGGPELGTERCLA